MHNLKLTLSLLNRNWFGTPWNVFSIQLDTKINDNLTSNTKLFGLVGERSVGFTATKCADAINLTNNYANRRVDRDFMRTLV
jgi:Fe(3+) dicitrate transport protein